jgi:hypothetical protein
MAIGKLIEGSEMQTQATQLRNVQQQLAIVLATLTKLQSKDEVVAQR